MIEISEIYDEEGNLGFKSEEDWILLCWSRDLEGNAGVQLINQDEISALRFKDFKSDPDIKVQEVSEKEIQEALVNLMNQRREN